LKQSLFLCNTSVENARMLSALKAINTNNYTYFDAAQAPEDGVEVWAAAPMIRTQRTLKKCMLGQKLKECMGNHVGARYKASERKVERNQRSKGA